MNLTALGLAAFAAFALAVPASAHHSFSMFDSDKSVALNGTVKEFEWTNPHSWIRINVADASGKELQWAVEMGGPAQISGRGWTPTIIRPGDKITVTVHPLRDGSRGGQFMSASFADGGKIGNY